MKFADFLLESEPKDLVDLKDTSSNIHVGEYTYKDIQLRHILFMPSDENVFQVEARADIEKRYKDNERVSLSQYAYNIKNDTFTALFLVVYPSKDMDTLTAGVEYTGKFNGTNWKISFVKEYKDVSTALKTIGADSVILKP